MWVKLDVVTKDRAHVGIEGHEGASDKLAIVEEDVPRHGTEDSSRDGGRSPLRRNQRGGEWWDPVEGWQGAGKKSTIGWGKAGVRAIWEKSARWPSNSGVQEKGVGVGDGAAMEGAPQGAARWGRPAVGGTDGKGGVQCKALGAR
jgi:hypothetical protein